MTAAACHPEHSAVQRTVEAPGTRSERREAPRSDDAKAAPACHPERRPEAEAEGSPAESAEGLFDLHCHLDFAEDPAELAAGLAERGVGCLSVTVTPEGYGRAADLLGACGNVRVGAGLHPWWVEAGPAGEDAAERAAANAAASRYVGEVGLDFGTAHASTRDAQIAAFERIARACAAEGGKVLSIHAVKSAAKVLDVLERAGALAENACIFHWFSGTSDELQRAIRAGCRFSVGPHMLASKRGRAYAQAVPAKRLLLETDEPPASGTPVPPEEFARLLQSALAEVAALRREDPAVLADRIARTSRDLLARP